jgi:hypothetical protein
MALWKSMGFAVEDLGRRITEFQLAEDATGQFLGAVAIQIADRHGLIHSEGFVDFSVADHLRPLLWDRIQSLATNHGLLRLWTREQAPFWSRCGLGKADAEALTKLPAAWKDQPAGWLTLKLREDVQALASIDAELALLMQSEKERTTRVLQQAKMLKILATLFAFIVVGAVLLAGFYLIRRNPHLLGH